MLAMRLDPRGGVGEWFGFQAAGAVLGVTAAGDEASLFEHLEVFRDGREGDIEWSGKLVDGGFPMGEASQDRPPGWVGESMEGAVEIGAGAHWYFTNRINNHLVKY